jgi:hypothetical protein
MGNRYFEVSFISVRHFVPFSSNRSLLTHCLFPCGQLCNRCDIFRLLKDKTYVLDLPLAEHTKLTFTLEHDADVDDSGNRPYVILEESPYSEGGSVEELAEPGDSALFEGYFNEVGITFNWADVLPQRCTYKLIVTGQLGSREIATAVAFQLVD